MKMRVVPPASIVWPWPLMVTELKTGESGPDRFTLVSISITLLVKGVALTCANAQLSVPTPPVVPSEAVPGSLATLTTNVVMTFLPLALPGESSRLFLALHFCPRQFYPGVAVPQLPC
jgi:hypothetical protein